MQVGRKLQDTGFLVFCTFALTQHSIWKLKGEQMPLFFESG
jgi:hypothetical protein